MCRRKCAPRLSPEAQELLSSHFVALRKEVQQVERDNDERSSIPITIRYVVRRLLTDWSPARAHLYLPFQSTRGYHSYIRVPREVDPLTCRAQPSRRRIHPALQILYYERGISRECRRPLPRRAAPRDHTDGEGAQEALACRVAYELSEFGEGIRQHKWLLEPCTGADPILVGEEGHYQVFESGSSDVCSLLAGEDANGALPQKKQVHRIGV